MVGRVINRARRLWIMIISVFLLLSVVATMWLIFSNTETEIPNKGVFVIQDGTA